MTGKEMWDVFVPLPMSGVVRCGEKRSMWRDDVVAARTASPEAAAAAVRLLGEGFVWRYVIGADMHERVDHCCCDDD